MSKLGGVMLARLVARCCLAALTLSGVRAFPTGAPCSQIDGMTPNHRGGVYDKAPYKIQFGAACYHPGVVLTATLRGEKDERFAGFVIQARPACPQADVDGNARVGQFLTGTNINYKLQCDDDPSSITHTWNDKKAALVADWIPPPDHYDDVVFVATVVQEYSSFWVKQVKSRRIRRCGQQQSSCTNVNIGVAEEQKPGQTVVIVDSGCDLPLNEGEYCGGYVERFYHRAGTCSRFWYAGCKGNDNRFVSEQACRDHCIDHKLTIGSPDLAEPEDKCSMAPAKEGSWCRPPGGSQQWSYARGICVQFWYLGCDGNANRFDSEKECTDACAGRGSCRRFVDQQPACEAWVRGDSRLCDKNGGSQSVRTACPQSCCLYAFERYQ